jgi:hypothetical protein
MRCCSSANLTSGCCRTAHRNCCCTCGVTRPCGPCRFCGGRCLRPLRNWLGANLFAVPPADAKLLRQLPQRALPGFISLQELAPQIIRVRLWHGLVLRRSPPQTYPRSIRSRYN